MNTSASQTYYRIGYVPAETDAPHDSYTPVEIYISSFYKAKLFIFLQGRGHGLMGGELSLTDLKKSYNKEIFLKCECEWALSINGSNFDSSKIRKVIIEKTGILIEKNFSKLLPS